jgi:hypothetical protein
LHIAADAGDQSIVYELLKKGVDVNARAEDRSTAYDIADLMGFDRVKKKLEKQGAKMGVIKESQASSSQDGADTVDESWYLGFGKDEVVMTLRKRLLDLVLNGQDPSKQDLDVAQQSWMELFHKYAEVE